MDDIYQFSEIDLVSHGNSALHQGMGSGSSQNPDGTQPSWDVLLTRVGSQRDKQAFALLYEHFAPRLKSFLLRLGTDIGVAEEIAQEAMVMVWRRAETYDPRQAGASTWIFTIARNKRIDRIRRDNRPLPDFTDPAFIQDSDEPGDIVLQRRQEEDKVQSALKKLPQEQAKMILSAYYEEKSHREIAEESGLPLGTVKSRIRLALNRLRSNLEEIER